MKVLSTRQRLGRGFLHIVPGVAMVVVVLLLVPASALADQGITVTASEFAFTPASVQLSAGQPVTLTFVNAGAIPHDLQSTMPTSSGGVAIPPIAPGQSAQLTFTPTAAGSYAITCSIPGHTEAGMKGVFAVS